ncbi:DUF1206 domain-containing protein [Streptomyces sp. SL13]|uniref:DUF1206 domain-containing protein n=1 Tax=Streptantibioticus silvisoli TaxID=2705255 RepID=A0AA90GVM9_9ACTN|nr:DUF1206 domain-containing protein [Streptantibioticus silvisoli]MDI5965405.1 DUF1206 domain-containing protein [Streptantibioticus silvisoli]MDI5968928.1 DUF1206 domain-containing protein [Streptantibioticus silvisoli]
MSPGTRKFLRGAGRAGFAARGVVYLLIGYLAVRIAFGHSGGEADRQGALRHIAGEPFGTEALWLLAAGFAGMTLWRGAAALTGKGQKKGARVAGAARAAFYAFVCWGTALYAAGAGGGSGGDSSSRDWTARALALPGGQFVVGAAGVGLGSAGVVIVVKAFRRTFLKKLDTATMSPRTRTVVTALGVGGNAARGAVYAAAGFFVLVAAIRFDPGRAKGMDDTLRALARTPAGPWLLVTVAVGLLLFGGFSFASARYRRT